MICPDCDQTMKDVVLPEYLFSASGLDNVFLVNCQAKICACGASPLLTMSHYLSMGVVVELLTKPHILNRNEFVFIRKFLFLMAEIDEDFADLINFEHQDLIKSNDLFIKKFISENDAIINAEMGREIRLCIARQFGLKNGDDLLKIGNKNFPVTPELDRKLRGLAGITISDSAYESYSKFDRSGNQKIYIVMPETKYS